MAKPNPTHSTNPTQFAEACGVPSPAGPVPIPYPNAGPLATGWETTNAGQRVKLQTKHGVHASQASRLTSSMGDQAGTAAKKGVISSQNRGKAHFKAWSMDVKFEGQNAVRHLDMTTHNHQ